MTTMRQLFASVLGAIMRKTILVDLQNTLETWTYGKEGTSISAPVVGSVKAITQLAEHYNIVLVSGDIFSGYTINRFISSYFPDIIDVVLTNNKSLVCGDIMIDDSVENVYETRCPVKILFGSNRQYSQFICFDTWEEIADYLLQEV